MEALRGHQAVGAYHVGPLLPEEPKEVWPRQVGSRRPPKHPPPLRLVQHVGSGLGELLQGGPAA
eukprot:3630011-Prorocentrum_lima.AAC.1